MWFGQMILLLVSMIYSIRYLRSGNLIYDIKAREFARTEFSWEFLAFVTGAIWATYTWVSHGAMIPSRLQ
ncbi:MAG: hypothetical protein U0T11_01040 [Chitinophagaceae bacterium]